MTGKLKFKGDQKVIIKLNSLKPLFKQACIIARKPQSEVSNEEGEARAALEAEWAEFQEEERRNAESQAAVLEAESAELKAKRQAEAEAAQESAQLEAEQFAKAAAAELSWGDGDEGSQTRARAESDADRAMRAMAKQGACGTLGTRARQRCCWSASCFDCRLRLARWLAIEFGALVDVRAAMRRRHMLFGLPPAPG